MSYYNKYQKYKSKYLALKGGNNLEFTIKQPWFDLINSGKKTVEGRLNRGAFSRIRVGDQITWVHKNLKCRTTVQSIHHYPSFKQMIEEEGIQNILPNIDSVDQGVDLYHQYYSPKDESNGVVAIGLSVQKTHDGKLKDPHYDDIRKGLKTFEVRVNDDKRKKINVGDEWIFSHNDRSDLPQIRTHVIGKKIYPTFREAIEDTDINKLLPGIDDIDVAIAMYERFPHDEGTYKDGAVKYGVVRFELKVE
jgi:ASC-1-like (ASCH) protein